MATTIILNITTRLIRIVLHRESMTVYAFSKAPRNCSHRLGFVDEFFLRKQQEKLNKPLEFQSAIFIITILH